MFDSKGHTPCQLCFPYAHDNRLTCTVTADMSMVSLTVENAMQENERLKATLHTFC